MKNINELNLNQEQKNIACVLINSFGTGEHPFADNNTIDNFTISYLKEIILNPDLIKSKEKQTTENLVLFDSLEKVLEAV